MLRELRQTLTRVRAYATLHYRKERTPPLSRACAREHVAPDDRCSTFVLLSGLVRPFLANRLNRRRNA
jgi:hypothetical protein